MLGLKLNFFWLRPSMMAWLFLNLGFLGEYANGRSGIHSGNHIQSTIAKHYQLHGGKVSHSMILYQLFTNIYVVDYFVFEEFVTSTWDIIAEK